MNNAANSVAPANAVLVVVHRRLEALEERWALFEGTVRPMRVVVRDVLVQHSLQVQASQPQHLDGEEVTLDDPGGLLAKERRPAQACSSRCRLNAVTAEDVPDAAGRERDAKPDHFAVDPLVPPARVLCREAQDELP